MQYRQCSRCVMDSTASEFQETKTGCNFCNQAERSLGEVQQSQHLLPEVIAQIKKDGQGKKYDCILGLSGGVDSSTVLHHAHKAGLRILAFSVDNGWNTPTSDENIMRLVETLRVPFYRYTIDLPKFKSLQAAFLQAGQKNAEIPTDHILMATTLEMANKYDIKWVLSGGNASTESIMPPSWGYNARDLVHIRDVYRKMTGKKLSGLPVCGLLKWNYYKWIKGIRTVYLLDYMDYKRGEAINLLEREYGWIDYGAKHEESQFTQWFQNFYLFEKFGIDKRKAHLSSMIVSGEITRDHALELLGRPLYYPELGIEKRVIRYKRRPYTDFKTDEKLFNFISKLVRLCRF